MAKRYGVPVDIFSIGFGPALVKKEWRDTTYQLAILPLGGYCRFRQDEQEARKVPSFGLYGRTSPQGTVAIMMGGIIANLLTALVSFTIAGFSRALNPLEGCKLMYEAMALTTTAFPAAFVETFTRLDSDKGFSSPIGIAAATVGMTFSATQTLMLLGYLSCSLVILNLVPLPILDGGQCILGLMQHVIKRPFSMKANALIAAIGTSLFTFFVVFILLEDVIKLFT